MKTVIDKVRALYGLSRGTQATLSIAQPTFAALLADENPAPGRLTLLVLACLTGFYAGFAINDLIDVRLDRQRLANDPAGNHAHSGFDVDSAGGRHPLAEGRLTITTAYIWVATLTTATLALTALLNPVCTALFIAAMLLEAAYCALARVSPLKFIVAGVVVATCSAVGWFAMRHDVDWPKLGLLLVWMAAWEIGGRNIPGDWADVEEDARQGIKTAPAVYGLQVSGRLTLGFLGVAILAGPGLMVAARSSFGLLAVIATAFLGWYTLLRPGLRLRNPSPNVALTLFNNASSYPAAILVIAAIGRLLMARS